MPEFLKWIWLHRRLTVIHLRSVAGLRQDKEMLKTSLSLIYSLASNRNRNFLRWVNYVISCPKKLVSCKQGPKMSMETQERKQLYSTTVAGEGMHLGVDLEMGPLLVHHGHGWNYRLKGQKWQRLRARGTDCICRKTFAWMWVVISMEAARRKLDWSQLWRAMSVRVGCIQWFEISAIFPSICSYYFGYCTVTSVRRLKWLIWSVCY